MGNLTMPLRDFSHDQLVAFEVPPQMPFGFEEAFLTVVNNTMGVGPEVTVRQRPSY